MTSNTYEEIMQTMYHRNFITYLTHSCKFIPMNNKMKLKYCAKSGRVTEAQAMNFDRHNYVVSKLK